MLSKIDPINRPVFDKVFKRSIKERYKILLMMETKVVKYISPLIRAVELKGSGMLCQSNLTGTGTESLSGGTEIIISGGNSDWSF